MSDNQGQNQVNKQPANEGGTQPVTAAATTDVQNVEVVEDTPEAVQKRREREQAALAANQGLSGNETTTVDTGTGTGNKTTAAARKATETQNK